MTTSQLYRRLMKEVHPDINKDPSNQTKARVVNKYKGNHKFLEKLSEVWITNNKDFNMMKEMVAVLVSKKNTPIIIPIEHKIIEKYKLTNMQKMPWTRGIIANDNTKDIAQAVSVLSLNIPQLSI